MNWKEMNAKLVAADERGCWEMLKEEKLAARRTYFLLRIYGKANKLRTLRERAELLK